MIFEVRVSGEVMAKVSEQHPDTRSAHGAPDSYDFVGGPLAAAVFAFRNFGALSFDVVPAVRSYMIPDPIFGAVVFVGVLVSSDTVEITGYSSDPDYWRIVGEDPDG